MKNISYIIIIIFTTSCSMKNQFSKRKHNNRNFTSKVANFQSKPTTGNQKKHLLSNDSIDKTSAIRKEEESLRKKVLSIEIIPSISTKKKSVFKKSFLKKKRINQNEEVRINITSNIQEKTKTLSVKSNNIIPSKKKRKEETSNSRIIGKVIFGILALAFLILAIVMFTATPVLFGFIEILLGMIFLLFFVICLVLALVI